MSCVTCMDFFFQVVFVKADCRSCTNSLETLAKVHKDLHMQGEVQADLLKVVLFIIQLKIKYLHIFIILLHVHKFVKDNGFT